MRIVLCVLLLLSARGNVSTAGELCRGWAKGTQSRVKPFRCPERPERADAKFCCGNCTLPFCCSSGKARLDQRLCCTDRQLEAAIRAVRVKKVTGSQPTIQISNASWFFIAVVLSWFLGFCVCMSRDKYRRWLLGQDEEPVVWEGAASPEMTSSSCDSSSYRTVDLPAYIAEDPPSSSMPLSMSANNTHLLWLCCANAGNAMMIDSSVAAIDTDVLERAPESTMEIEPLA
ncbi:protein shisa-3-like [Rhineura floridana]|uniref:protein shisa-3-like n=1 Tax=Rhineura floridana TaxID=261503 RepID=UPI002AC7F2A4|nr:protein shisa-3-like [Rhineura floridana]